MGSNAGFSPRLHSGRTLIPSVVAGFSPRSTPFLELPESFAALLSPFEHIDRILHGCANVCLRFILSCRAQHTQSFRTAHGLKSFCGILAYQLVWILEASQQSGKRFIPAQLAQGFGSRCSNKRSGVL